MHLSDYRAFATLAETLHFSRSARRLNMSPSALTRAVQRMEEDLGEVLLLRDKRNVRLSRAGEVFAEHARGQLEAHQQLLERLAEETRDPAGELRIACTVTACHSILPRLLSECRRDYPRIHLRLVTCDAVEAMTRLQRDDVHVAVVPQPDRLDATLAFAQLARTGLLVIAPVDDRRLARAGCADGTSLSEVPWILPEGGLERQRFDRFMATREVEHPDIYAEVSGNEAIIAMVSLGCGLGIVPELVLAGSPLRDAVVPVPIADGPAGFAVGLCTKRRDLRRRSLAALWQLADSPDHS
ncbi:MAG: HTH-type transcriptional activator IlvY [Myxococcales bacterium]|nr:HTH-type transcriptional activator IlvY [Myxococcales bacterium]MDD9964806.1 HTH-type transcriptional activator IlvY [Myxococcales bacterium]